MSIPSAPFDIKPFPWGEREKQLRQRASTKDFVVHHTASPDVSAATIDGWHRQNFDVVNGKKVYWIGLGYHFIIRESGAVEAGRPLWAVGAHAGPGNVASIGVVVACDCRVKAPAPAQMAALVKLYRWLKTIYPDLRPRKHSDFMATACPGPLFPWSEFVAQLGTAAAAPSRGLRLVVNGRAVAAPLRVEAGRTMVQLKSGAWVPVRDIVDTLDGSIPGWEGDDLVIKI